jgi:uncharacterized membrane protein SirB2
MKADVIFFFLSIQLYSPTEHLGLVFAVRHYQKNWIVVGFCGFVMAICFAIAFLSKRNVHDHQYNLYYSTLAYGTEYQQIVAAC